MSLCLVVGETVKCADTSLYYFRERELRVCKASRRKVLPDVISRKGEKLLGRYAYRINVAYFILVYLFLNLLFVVYMLDIDNNGVHFVVCVGKMLRVS